VEIAAALAHEVAWIDATKRMPEQRPQRIAEMIDLLEAGHQERPLPSTGGATRSR
jgi:hypothetical protein